MFDEAHYLIANSTLPNEKMSNSTLLASLIDQGEEWNGDNYFPKRTQSGWCCFCPKSRNDLGHQQPFAERRSRQREPHGEGDQHGRYCIWQSQSVVDTHQLGRTPSSELLSSLKSVRITTTLMSAGKRTKMTLKKVTKLGIKWAICYWLTGSSRLVECPHCHDLGYTTVKKSLTSWM